MKHLQTHNGNVRRGDRKTSCLGHLLLYVYMYISVCVYTFCIHVHIGNHYALVNYAIRNNKTLTIMTK